MLWVIVGAFDSNISCLARVRVRKECPGLVTSRGMRMRMCACKVTSGLQFTSRLENVIISVQKFDKKNVTVEPWHVSVSFVCAERCEDTTS